MTKGNHSIHLKSLASWKKLAFGVDEFDWDYLYIVNICRQFGFGELNW